MILSLPQTSSEALLKSAPPAYQAKNKDSGCVQHNGKRLHLSSQLQIAKVQKSLTFRFQDTLLLQETAMAREFSKGVN